MLDPLFTPLMPDAKPARLAYAGGSFDRSAAMRREPERLEKLRAAPDARFLLLCGEEIIMHRTGPQGPWFSPQEAANLNAEILDAEKLGTTNLGTEDPVFLGLEAAGLFAAALPKTAAPGFETHPEFKLSGLRGLALAATLPPATLAHLATAKSILHWHARHGFCSACGAPTRMAEAGWKRLCEACKTEHFPRTDPVVIMLVVQNDHCLLGNAPHFAPNIFSTLAGFVEPGETLEDAVRRETFEETGIRCGKVALVANQPWPFPASLMIGAMAQALNSDLHIDTTELASARWFTRQEVTHMLASTHPDGLCTPPAMSIANHLMQRFCEAA